MIIFSQCSPQELTLSSPIYRQYQSKNASKKTPFHEQHLPVSPQEHSFKYVRHNHLRCPMMEEVSLET